jgi:hypothetical protein
MAAPGFEKNEVQPLFVQRTVCHNSIASQAYPRKTEGKEWANIEMKTFLQQNVTSRAL